MFIAIGSVYPLLAIVLFITSYSYSYFIEFELCRLLRMCSTESQFEAIDICCKSPIRGFQKCNFPVILQVPIFYVFFYFDSIADVKGQETAVIMVLTVIVVVAVCVIAYWIHNKKLILKLIDLTKNTEMVIINNPLRENSLSGTDHKCRITEAESFSSELNASKITMLESQ